MYKHESYFRSTLLSGPFSVLKIGGPNLLNQPYLAKNKGPKNTMENYINNKTLLCARVLESHELARDLAASVEAAQNQSGQRPDCGRLNSFQFSIIIQI